MLASWDLKIRIPHRKLRIWSYSQVETRQKKVNKANKEIFQNLSVKFRALKLRFLALSEGPGGFRELREAGRNHFHPSWYLSVPGVAK